MKTRLAGAVALGLIVAIAPVVSPVPPTAIAAPSPASAPALAPAANRVSAFYSVSLGSSLTIPGSSRVHLGDVVVTHGSVSEYQGGRVGTITITETVVDPNYPGGSEARIARGAFVTSRGTIFAEALVVAKHNQRPETSWYMSVVGGTGFYSSARGTMTLNYVKGRPWLLSLDATLESTGIRKAIEVARLDSTDTSSTRPGGLGASTATVGAVRGGGQFLSIATTIDHGTAADDRIVDAAITTSAGTVLLRGLISQPRTGGRSASSYAVLGGTGIFSAARGEARIAPESPTRLKVSLSYARPNAGRALAAKITTTQARAAEGAIIGGDVRADIGKIKGKLTDAKGKVTDLAGTYDQITTASVAVGDVTVHSVAAVFTMTGGSVVLGAVRASQQPDVLVVSGGTSSWGGARGTASVTQLRRGVASLGLSVWTGGVGPAG